jgi:hypothetical protein
MFGACPIVSLFFIAAHRRIELSSPVVSEYGSPQGVKSMRIHNLFVCGQSGSETAVEIIIPKSIRIFNKKDGVVNQVVINTLSEDNNTINNEYLRMDKDGKITALRT